MTWRSSLALVAAAWMAANLWVMGSATFNRSAFDATFVTLNDCRVSIRYGDRPTLSLRTVSYYLPADPPLTTAERAQLFGFGPEQQAWDDVRHAWVAMEAEGPAVDGYARRFDEDEVGLRRAMPTPLVIRDVAPRKHTLLERYAGDPTIIVARGEVRPPNEALGGESLNADLRVKDLHLSLEQRKLLSTLEPQSSVPCQPRLDITIGYGATRDPWVERIVPRDQVR